MFKSTSFKFLFFLFIWIGQIGYTQVHAQIKISAIEITGNKKTRDFIVKRELPYIFFLYLILDGLIEILINGGLNKIEVWIA